MFKQKAKNIMIIYYIVLKIIFLYYKEFFLNRYNLYKNTLKQKLKKTVK